MCEVLSVVGHALPPKTSLVIIYTLWASWALLFWVREKWWMELTGWVYCVENGVWTSFFNEVRGKSLNTFNLSTHFHSTIFPLHTSFLLTLRTMSYSFRGRGRKTPLYDVCSHFLVLIMTIYVLSCMYACFLEPYCTCVMVIMDPLWVEHEKQMMSRSIAQR